MAILWVERATTLYHDIPSGHSESETVKIGSFVTSHPKYFPTGIDTAVDSDGTAYWEVSFVAASWTEPATNPDSSELSGPTWVQIEVPDGFVIPDDLDDPSDPGGPDGPDDPEPSPVDYFSKYTVHNGIVYDQFGQPAPYDEFGFQSLEDIGDPAIHKVLDLGGWVELEGTPTGNAIPQIKEHWLTSDSPLAQAIRMEHFGSAKAVEVLTGPEAAPQLVAASAIALTADEVATSLDEVFWAAQRDVVAALDELVAGNLIPAFSNAPDSEQQVIYEAFSAMSVAMVANADGGFDVYYGNSSKTFANGSSFGAWLTGPAMIAGSIHGDVISLPKGGNAYLGPGDDVGIAGPAEDTFLGGPGVDRFDFDAAKGIGKKSGKRDTILDFTAGEDQINLSTIDANGSRKGNKFKFLKKEGADFTEKAGQLAFDQKKSVTLVEGDVNGDGKADFRLELSGTIDLQKGDFIL